jgi:hypothetical protein
MSGLGLCIECTKGKQTGMCKYTVNHMTNFLELIHTDICEPFLRQLGMVMYILSVSLTIIQDMAIVRPFFARSAPPQRVVGDGMRKKDTEIPPKRAFV